MDSSHKMNGFCSRIYLLLWILRMTGPNKFPDKNSNLLRNVSDRAKYKLKMLVEYIGFASPLILATNDFIKHTTNKFLKLLLDLSLYIAIDFFMKLSVPGKDKNHVPWFWILFCVHLNSLYKSRGFTRQDLSRCPYFLRYVEQVFLNFSMKVA